MVHRIRILPGKSTLDAIDIHPSRSAQKLGAPAMLVAHSDGGGWFYEDFWSGMMSNLYFLRCFCKVPLNFELGVWWNFWNLLVPFNTWRVFLDVFFVSFHVQSCLPKLRKLQVEEISTLPFTAPWFGYLSSKQVIFLSADFKGLGMHRSERGKIMCTTVGK